MAKPERKDIEEYHLNQHKPEQAQFIVHDLKTYLRDHQPNTTKPHIHSFYQIIWFQSGTGHHYVDFIRHDVKDQMVFFIAKNQVHCFDQNDQYEGYLLHFNEIFLANDYQSDVFLKHNLFNNPQQQPYCKLTPKCTGKLQLAIDQINEELGEATLFGKDELLRSYLQSFLILIGRTKLSSGNDAGTFVVDEKRLQLVKFFNLVEQHYKKGLSVTEYAELLHISARTLSDLTSQQVNKTPSQMIQERIILEAQRLLVHSGLNINQIAYRTGFDDPSYFVKFFKKHTGISPSDFRKSIS
ncbi:helix-turn-helix domain-containing protein [Pedobacter steynii]